jgi:hypothetical protein
MRLAANAASLEAARDTAIGEAHKNGGIYFPIGFFAFRFVTRRAGK